MNEIKNEFSKMTEEQLQQIAGGVDENGNLSDVVCEQVNKLNLFERCSYGGPAPKELLRYIRPKVENTETEI